jgi:hypothetical protein
MATFWINNKGGFKSPFAVLTFTKLSGSKLERIYFDDP